MINEDIKWEQFKYTSTLAIGKRYWVVVNTTDRYERKYDKLDLIKFTSLGVFKGTDRSYIRADILYIAECNEPELPKIENCGYNVEWKEYTPGITQLEPNWYLVSEENYKFCRPNFFSYEGEFEYADDMVKYYSEFVYPNNCN